MLSCNINKVPQRVLLWEWIKEYLVTHMLYQVLEKFIDIK